MTLQTSVRRKIDKQEAIRHLIHAAIRMIRAEEDPFAIHVIIQSAEKMLSDIGKRRGVELAHEMGASMSDAARKQFFQRYRETYNFFKHADKDHDAFLEVPDMMMLNVIILSGCIINHHLLFDEQTDHMKTHLVFTMATFPGATFKAEARHLATKGMDSLSPREFFAGLRHPVVAQRFPNMKAEVIADLEDNGDFFNANMTELERKHLRK